VLTILPSTQRQPFGPSARRHPLDVGSLGIGVGAGVMGILCCVSPVVLFLLGVSTATEAVTLGDKLYYGYAWYFRGAGLLVAAVTTIFYLGRCRSCSLAGAATTGGRC